MFNTGNCSVPLVASIDGNGNNGNGFGGDGWGWVLDYPHFRNFWRLG